ncbi:MAG: hypothetical protein ACOCT9_02795 [archaeon]
MSKRKTKTKQQLIDAYRVLSNYDNNIRFSRISREKLASMIIIEIKKHIDIDELLTELEEHYEM